LNNKTSTPQEESQRSSAKPERSFSSSKPAPRNAGLSNKLWIDGLKRGARETIQVNFALREAFGKYGSVVDCDLKITTSSRMKGQACITMSTNDEATEACRNLNGEPFMDHGNLRVDIVDPNKSYAKKSKWRGGGRGGRGGGRGRGRGGRDRDYHRRDRRY